MRKIYTFVSAILLCAVMSSCGNMGGMGTGASSGNNGASIINADAIGNLISTFASGIMTNQQTLLGTWTYSKPCVQFESESLLAKAGGAVAASSIEGKLAGVYQKVGINPGTMVFAFANDGTMQYSIGGRVAEGKYVFDAATKTITITTQAGLNVKAYVSVSINSLGLTFEASKLLSLVNAAAAASSKLSSISSVTGNFSGMKVGFQFTK